MRKTRKFFISLAFMAFGLSASLFAGCEISAADLPDGFAGLAFEKFNEDSAVTVTTKKDLLAALQKGGLIYIDGVIDMSEGMLPEKGGESNALLDDFVKKHSDFSTYIEYRNSYVASCSASTEDSSKSNSKSPLYETMHALNLAYKYLIQLPVLSNTAIIGLGENSGLSGGTIAIKNSSNIIIRNLNIGDAYDPFPHHEENDGYNAQHDAISIENSKNVWIDHCTLYDTKELVYFKTGGSLSEKWQTYDGLCDITKNSDNVTISYCKFMNHGKTMLIGSSDSEKIDAKDRKITIHHNYFYNCASRLPMVRLSTIHLYNNYYDGSSDGFYSNSYALGARYNCQVIAENNYFGPGIKNSYSGNAKKPGTVYSAGEIDKSKGKKRKGECKLSKKPLFTIPYKYELTSAEKLPDLLKKEAGAGILSVKK